MVSESFDMNYGVTDRLRLRIYAPYVTKEMEMTTMGHRVTRRSTGLGDATMMLKYRLNTPIGSHPTFAVGAGFQLGIGPDDVRDGMGVLPAKMQPGTGITTPILGAWFSKKLLPWAFHGGVMYKLGGENGQTGYAPGDAIMSNWTAGYVLNEHWNLLTELNFRQFERDKQGGVIQADSGGTVLFLTPGVQCKQKDGSYFEMALQTPIIHNLHGSQMKPATTVYMGMFYSL